MRHVLAGIIASFFLYVIAPALATSEDDMELTRILTVEQIDLMHGVTFETYVCKILESQGYTVENIRASNDYGVDAIASKGEDKIAIQIKRSKYPIDRRAVSDAGAGKDFYKCKRAMVITNNTLTESAKKFAAEIQCTVVEREELLKWIAKFKQETKRPSEESGN